MARPKKLSTEIMIMIVDSYYLARSDGNEKLMKCSLIAEYAVELGYLAQGYDFRRNLEVREHIERLKVCAETCMEVYGETYKHSGYRTLDVNEFLHNNKGDIRLTTSLREIDDYWKRVYEYSEHALNQNRLLMKEKAENEEAFRNKCLDMDILIAQNGELSGQNNKLSLENRYLRKMLRTYLYPAVADEILKRDNELPRTNTEVTENAASNFIESGAPKSFEVSVSGDKKMQSEASTILERLWGLSDE